VECRGAFCGALSDFSIQPLLTLGPYSTLFESGPFLCAHRDLQAGMKRIALDAQLKVSPLRQTQLLDRRQVHV
jgi:hypothetical protein